MKKILLLPILLFFTFSLTSCSSVQILSAVEILSDQIPTKATTGFRLNRALPGGVVVTWESSNDEVINVNGQYAIVNRTISAHNVMVVLTATLSLNAEEEVLIFNVNVPTIQLVTEIPNNNNLVSIRGEITQIVLTHTSNSNRFFVISDGVNEFRIRTRNVSQTNVNQCVERAWILSNLSVGMTVVVTGIRETFSENTYLGVNGFLHPASERNIIIVN